MSFPVAVQSAVFYFMACTPCSKARQRLKQTQKAKRDREDKRRMEAENPHLYQHPDPFHTNPYWAEEMKMGPSLPKRGRGGGSKNASERGLTSAGQDGSLTTRSSLAISQTGTGQSGARSVAAPPPLPSPGVDTVLATPTGQGLAGDELVETESASTGDDWNRKRYQREDEELWGHDLSRKGHMLMDAIKQAGTTAGRFVEENLLGKDKSVTEEDRFNFYFSPKNPPVNDYHPPVVSSRPAHKNGHLWMLQPPPPAKVMEGKVPVSRSASMMSVGSRRTIANAEAPPLGRLVGEKAVEAKIRKGETLTEGETLQAMPSNRPRPGRTTTGSTLTGLSQRSARSRSLSLSTESEDSAGSFGRSRSRRVRRAAVPPGIRVDDSEDEYISKSLESLSNTTLPVHAAQRPRLSTIMSSDVSQPDSTTRIDKVASGPLREVQNASPNAPSNPTKGEAAASSPDSGLALSV